MTTSQSMRSVELRVLGPVELWEDGQRKSLPRSKKSRALLAYLAITRRSHRRERLCELLWDVTDDPRGALRWSLSRLRRAMGSEGERIQATREEVSLVTEGMSIDALGFLEIAGPGLQDASTTSLEALASKPRGEFLEGLDMHDFLDFNAWCIAERERFRERHVAILVELVQRLGADPARALPHARRRVQIDPFDVSGHTSLLRLLLDNGKRQEAHQRFASGRRLFQEVGPGGAAELERAWGGLLGRREEPPVEVAVQAPPEGEGEAERAPSRLPFVGRDKELRRLEELIGLTRKQPTQVALLTGEPGSGKSRLAERLAGRALSGGFCVLMGGAYEAESKRPYGPWVDALDVDVRTLVGDDAPSREALFQAFAERLVERSTDTNGVVLILDDVQWLDPDSAQLAHFIARTTEVPLFVLLLARSGELNDNEACLRSLRGMRKAAHVEELAIEPLSQEEIRELVGDDGVDPQRVFHESAGNPLYAIELARAQSAGKESTSSTLLQLVRERVEQLPEHAADVLRWGAVLGHAMEIDRLEVLSSLSLDDLVTALERLERAALLHLDDGRVRQRYVFSHDVVRDAVYRELSHPRRRLMHRKVALLLEPQTSDAEMATEIAHHAGLAGEALLGVRACIVAGQQALRVFANGDAEALAKRGLHLAEGLDEAWRVEAMLDLLHVLYEARTPVREQAAVRVRELAERSLDLGLTRAARLGFQMLSYLRWESASMADAHANIMQAERVSRSASPDERQDALAQAARCLILLERNLGQAEAFSMEADALAVRAERSSPRVAFAHGMLAGYRGELDDATRAFREARLAAREAGERLAEFMAVEHWTMLEIDRGGLDDADQLSTELAELGQRVRPGAEAATGKALRELVRVVRGAAEATVALAAAVEDVRSLDAKFELSFLLTRWARHELERGNSDAAQRLARDGLATAEILGRASEQAIALWVLTRCGEGEDAAVRLAELAKSQLSWAARRLL